MINSIKLAVFYIFTLPDVVISYFSGTFTAAAINILTSKIPNSIFSIRENAWAFFAVAIMFFAISLLFIRWITTVKQAMIRFNNNEEILSKDNAKEIWYQIICELKLNKKLLGILMMIFLLIVASFSLLIFPEIISYLERIVINAISIICQVLQR